MKTKFNIQVYLLPTLLSLIIGLLIGWIDSGKNWDDAGITAFAIFATTLSLGSFWPKGAWLWALLVGGSVFLFNVFRNNNYQSFLALVISFIGAYAGFGLRKLVTHPL
jgi:hypothetical protein